MQIRHSVSRGLNATLGAASDRLTDVAAALHMLAERPRPTVDPQDPAPDTSNLSQHVARSLVRIGNRAHRQGRDSGYNLALLLLHMGNTVSPANPLRQIVQMAPAEVARAAREGRIRVNIEP